LARPTRPHAHRRRQVILTCASGAEVLEAMSDVSQLQAVPLLQAVLFSG
jgi:hypothetical protein